MALGRRGPWNVVTMIVSVAGERIAPPTPWIARTAISLGAARRETRADAGDA